MTSRRLIDRVRATAPFALGAMLTGSSVLHAVRPGFFRPMVPPVLGRPDPWVYGSGVVEAVVGVGLLTGQPWAGRAGAALMLAVLPGNVQMALDAGSGRTPGPQDNRLVAWGRLPLQAPLVWAALQSRPRTRSADRGRR